MDVEVTSRSWYRLFGHRHFPGHVHVPGTSRSWYRLFERRFLTKFVGGFGLVRADEGRESTVRTLHMLSMDMSHVPLQENPLAWICMNRFQWICFNEYVMVKENRFASSLSKKITLLTRSSSFYSCTVISITRRWPSDMSFEPLRVLVAKWIT